MKKSPASSYEYEARLGRNQVVYLLGRDKEGNVKRCYWMEKTFYTDVPFYKKYGGMTFSNIEISNKGEIYLEKTSGGLIIPYYDFYERIGFGVSTEKRRTVLGERRAYQLVQRDGIDLAQLGQQIQIRISFCGLIVGICLTGDADPLSQCLLCKSVSFPISF